MYIIILFLLFFCIIDLIFYIPIKIHILVADDVLGLYIFNIPIIYISQTKNINRLKNKIPLAKLKNAQKEDIKYIESINVDKLYINYDLDKTNLFNYTILLPLFGLLNSLDKNFNKNKIEFSMDKQKKYLMYGLINVKIAKIISNYFIIRRLKNERTSNKRNLKNVDE